MDLGVNCGHIRGKTFDLALLLISLSAHWPCALIQYWRENSAKKVYAGNFQCFAISWEGMQAQRHDEILRDSRSYNGISFVKIFFSLTSLCHFFSLSD